MTSAHAEHSPLEWYPPQVPASTLEVSPSSRAQETSAATPVVDREEALGGQRRVPPETGSPAGGDVRNQSWRVEMSTRCTPCDVRKEQLSVPCDVHTEHSEHAL